MHIERIEPNTKEWNLFYANHIVRYEFANIEFKKNKYKSILDIATGVGYGANYLAKSGFENITGVDIDDKSLIIAKKIFTCKNINFIKDDCNNLKIVNRQKYDGIVSFETLEHLTNYNYFVKELYKLLNDNGTLIISTPNILVTEHQTKKDWHYHEKEFTPKEFFNLIKDAGFSNIQFYGQQYTKIGRLRNDLRHEINILRSNPFARLGMWFQEKFKKYSFNYPLPEHLDDFDIVEYDVNECENLGKSGPFVLLIVAKK